MHTNDERRCVPISVLIPLRRIYEFSLKTAVLLSSLSLAAVFHSLWCQVNIFNKESCKRIHKKPLRRTNKSRYRKASFTAEASLAFPVFFFAVLYLLQMFRVLGAELEIAQAGITSAREAAVYSYAADRLAKGENATAERLLNVFDHKVIRDATMTGLFYARCDGERLKQAGVAQGIGGVWVDSEQKAEKTYAEIRYRVKPANVLTKEQSRYYVTKIVYRNWIGENGTSGKEATETDTVYMTEHGSVYHVKANCSYIKIEIEPVLAQHVGDRRNRSGAKYYACEFCKPVLKNGTQVYITEYGIRYHEVSTCSAIERNVKACSLEEVRKNYAPCSRCGQKGETE